MVGSQTPKAPSVQYALTPKAPSVQYALTPKAPNVQYALTPKAPNVQYALTPKAPNAKKRTTPKALTNVSPGLELATTLGTKKPTKFQTLKALASQRGALPTLSALASRTTPRPRVVPTLG
jgi:hypothetical protein